jgi:hypothetical protein
MDPHGLPPWATLLQMVTGSWVSQVVGAAARLGIADQLAAAPRTPAEVAQAVGAHPPSVARLMRALASLGVLTQPQPDKFGLSPIGECLRSSVPGTLRDFAIAETDHAHWATWERFTDSVRTGKPMAREVLGVQPWEYYEKHPDDAERFSAAMGNLSNLVTPAIVESYDFSRAALIVDVAGAHGVLLAEILQRNSKARGVLMDLPHIVKQAPPVLMRYEVADRVQMVGGDMFKEVPPGGDLYLLKNIIHDWNDERSVEILKCCRAAMKPDGKVLLVELVIPPNNGPSPAQMMDMNMMVMLDGKERAEAEYASILQAARLKLDRTILTPSPFCIVQASAA